MDTTFASTTNMLIVKDGKVLLMKRSDDLPDFPGWYILPGGKQEKNETPQEAAIRETVEETGIKAVNPRLRIVATHYHEYKSKVYLVYIFESSEFDSSLKESKEGVPQWMPMDEALNHPKLYPDLRRHIKLITDSKSNDIIYTYHRFNKKLEITESR